MLLGLYVYVNRDVQKVGHNSLISLSWLLRNCVSMLRSSPRVLFVEMGVVGKSLASSKGKGVGIGGRKYKTLDTSV